MVEVMKIGISPFFRKMATSTTILVVNRALISYGGSSSVAVLGIIDTISSIIFMIVMGINEGTQPIISYNYGARNIIDNKNYIEYLSPNRKIPRWRYYNIKTIYKSIIFRQRKLPERRALQERFFPERCKED
jgi:hypothetical protein